MKIELDFISGLMFGLEFFDEEVFGTGVIFDLGIIRVVVYKGL